MADIEDVLANWIREASAPPGSLATGIEPARWAAERFVKWWQAKVASSLDDAEGAATRLRDELQELGGWSNERLAGAMEEITHLEESLASLRMSSGLADAQH
jgi:hypothetical protein